MFSDNLYIKIGVSKGHHELNVDNICTLVTLGEH